jgi:uncharacterized protein YrrD
MSEDQEHALFRTFLSRSFGGKLIISRPNGKIIAKIEDLLIDPQSLQVAALVTSKGGLLNREWALIPRNRVEIWGEDIVLVSSEDVMTGADQLPDTAQWLSVDEQIHGQDIVDMEGTRLGVLDDIAIDAQGKIVGYVFSQVFVDGPLAELKRVGVDTTESLGQDVLIVKPLSEQEATQQTRDTHLVKEG